MAKFLYPENKKFVIKEIDLPVNIKEILEEKSPDIDFGRSIFGILVHIVRIVMWLFMLLILGIAVYAVFNHQKYDTITIVGGICLIPIAIVTACFWIYVTLEDIYFYFSGNWEKIIVDDISSHGKILEGKIIDIKIGSHDTIKFHFEHEEKKVVGVYRCDLSKTDIKDNFDLEKDTVIVLYSSYCTVLL
jgi:hypothetical protein